MITEATRTKMRRAALTRDNTARIAAMPRGNRHWNWKEKPSRLTIHKRLHRSIGKASRFACVDCGKPAFDWSCEGREDSTNPADYKPRCRSCHVKKDKNWIRRAR